MPRVLAILAVWLVVTPGPAGALEHFTISQKGRVFLPTEITIKPGQTINITNDDVVLHHVYVESSSFNFDSGEQPPGAPVSIKFTHRGDFEVRCDIHPKMLLRVYVR